jgi:hypothetical protein
LLTLPSQSLIHFDPHCHHSHWNSAAHTEFQLCGWSLHCPTQPSPRSPPQGSF